MVVVCRGCNGGDGRVIVVVRMVEVMVVACVGYRGGDVLSGVATAGKMVAFVVEVKEDYRGWSFSFLPKWVAKSGRTFSVPAFEGIGWTRPSIKTGDRGGVPRFERRLQELYTMFSTLAGKLRWRWRSWVFDLNKSGLCPSFVEGLTAKGLKPSRGRFPYCLDHDARFSSVQITPSSLRQVIHPQMKVFHSLKDDNTSGNIHNATPKSKMHLFQDWRVNFQPREAACLEYHKGEVLENHLP
uniref:Uncharacterized protein n=1 Tax=Tanacetum cinerariifolium TaxID=118510 RepID=A0A6L2JIQ8_TANCI|nr:hypothetical protein [Tanacetum cinerariifolium]